MAKQILASATTLEDIKELVERRYHGPKELVKISDKEYHIQGMRNGVPYTHANDVVQYSRGRYRHYLILPN